VCINIDLIECVFTMGAFRGTFTFMLIILGECNNYRIANLMYNELSKLSPMKAITRLTFRRLKDFFNSCIR